MELPKIDIKPKISPLIASLPEYLKDPKNFKKIQKALLDAGATRHSHAEMVNWAGCRKCQQKQWDRKEMMKKLGFQSAGQYLIWCKIHGEIKKRMPLTNWK